MSTTFLSVDQVIATQTISAQTSGATVEIGRNKKFTLAVDGKCYLNWAGIDATFALDPLTATDYTTLAFTAPDQIVRAAGSWITDGYTAGRFITIAGAADPANNGTFEIETTTATDLTTVEVTLATEGASTTESVSGHRLLEVADTDVLIPAAGSYTFQTDNGFEAIRIYNPDAITDLLVTVSIAHNV